MFQQLAAQEADAVPVGGQRRGCPDVAAFQNFGRTQAAAPQLLQNILALPLGLVLQQQGLPLQPLPGKAALPGGSLLQRVSLAEHGVHPVPAQHPVAQTGMPGKAHIKGQVDLAFQQFVVQLGAGCFLNAELHLRELRAERRKHLRQRKAAPERRHAHMQHTGVCPEQVGQLRVHLPLLAEQPLGVGQIPLARIGQLQPPPRPLEQHKAGVPFHFLQKLGKGRLADVELLSRAGDVAAPGNGRKIFQIFEVHADSSLLRVFAGSSVPQTMHAGYSFYEKNEFQEL